MNRGNLKIENTDKILIKLSKILEFIPNNSLNWYILELSASGKIKSSSLNVNMLELMKQIRINKNGLKIKFSGLLDLAKHLDSLDECFVIGCNKENNKSINQIVENKENYEYIIDYFDSTILNIYSSNLIFLEKFLKSYNNSEFETKE